MAFADCVGAATGAVAAFFDFRAFGCGAGSASTETWASLLYESESVAALLAGKTFDVTTLVGSAAPTGAAGPVTVAVSSAEFTVPPATPPPDPLATPPTTPDALPALPARIAPHSIPELVCGAGFDACGWFTCAVAAFAPEAPARAALFARVTAREGLPGSRDAPDPLRAMGAPSASARLAPGAEGGTAMLSIARGTDDAAPVAGAFAGDGAEFVSGSVLAGGGASGRTIATWVAGSTGFFMRKAIPVIASSATSIAAAGIDQRGPVSHAHAPAVFCPAASASPTPPARAIAASCSRQCEQREKCRS